MSKRKNIAAGAAVLGGAALAVWLLSSGRRGWRLGGGATRKGGGTPCRVRVDRSDLKIKGEVIDLPGAVAACKEAGRAEVSASGAAVVSVVLELIQKLRAGGMDVRTDPDIWRLAGLRPEDWLA